MRIPFPERVPLNRVAMFAAVFFLIQIVEGTYLYFAVGCVVFILVAALAFNAGGGLTRTAGTYVISYALMAVLLGIGYKAFLGEPAQSNLLDPLTDIETYVGSIVAMYAAVIVSRRFRRKAGLLQNFLEESTMHQASVGCIVFGAAAVFVLALLGASGAKLITVFNQLNELIPLGIIIGVTFEIRRSGGTRSVNLFTVLGGAYLFITSGILGFSKQGMLTPLVCWFLPVCALRYRLSFAQVLSCILGTFIIFHYLVPYSQYGRVQVPEEATYGQRAAIALGLLETMGETRRLYYESEDSVDPSVRGLNSYYSTPQGFWERLQMVSVDDKLNYFTDNGRTFGMWPIEVAFLNVVPHFIWPNKPEFNAGYNYALEISGRAFDPDAPEIGISFSPTGEAYHLARWTGVLVLAPLLWCMLFFTFDVLLGDLRATPWGILALSLVSFIAPEGGLTGVISLCTLGAEALIFCAFFAAWFAPLVGEAVVGPGRRKRKSTVFGPANA